MLAALFFAKRANDSNYLQGTTESMADNQDSLIREVQGELHKEKYEKLWKDYGSFLIAGVIAAVLAVGGYQYWSASHRASVWKAGEDYEAALALRAEESSQGGDAAKSLKAFEELAKESPGGYRILSQLQLAGAQVAAGKKKEALALYEAISKRDDADVIFRDFAALQAATLRVGDADWTEIENRITKLTGGISVWRHSALQLLGVAAFNEGKIEKAREVFEQLLSDPKVPSSIRDRASLFMARIVAQDMKAELENAKAGETTLEPSTAKASDGSKPDANGQDEKPKAQDGASTGGASTSTNSP